jgi:Mrp family chromosome partitioning ATPase
MERIRRALDLAREERARHFAATVEPPEAFEATTVREGRASPVAATVEPPGAHKVVTMREERVRPAINPVEPSQAVEATTARVEPARPVAATVEPLPAFEATTTQEESGRPVAATVQPLPAFEAKTVTNVLTRIQYTKTKTFSPSAALLESNRIVDASGSSAAASAFRMLRTQVLQRMKEHHWRSLAVLSPSSDDGKTTTAINLAINLSNDHHHTVLLVEFDLKRPTIADKLGIVPEMGADDLLRGNAGVEDCLYHPEGFDRLVVLPARAAMDNSSETLAGPRCRELVAELRDRYPDRLLVFDLPPVLGADDALAFTPLVECALVVVAEGSTRREDLLRCMELLRKTPIVGTVLNRATDSASAYG